MTASGQIGVVQLLDTLAVGGKERVAVNLANGLAGLGHNSHVVASRNLGPLALELSSGVRLFCAERSGKLDLSGIRRISRYIDDNGLKIVHSHNQSSSYLVRCVLRFCRTKPLHVVHDHNGPGLTSRKQAFLDRLMLNRVDAYISVSHELQQRAGRLLGLPEDRCVFIRNGIHVPPEKPPFEGRPTVVQVANLHDVKDHATAAHAASLLRQQLPDLRWRCIGRMPEPPDDYVRGLQELVRSLGLEGCFELLGERTDIEALLAEAHVGTLTSCSEGLPLSLLEYMACRLPVVITDTGQGPQIVRQAEAGVVVPVGDPNGTARALRRILSDLEQARRLGDNARRHVLQHFSTDNMVREILTLYMKLIEG